MDELFRMLSVRAPQVTTDPNIVTITPKEFRTPPPPIVDQYKSFLTANQYDDISLVDFSRAGALFPALKNIVVQTASEDSANLDPVTFNTSIQTAFGKTATDLSGSADFLALQSPIADNIVALLIGAKQKAGVNVSPAISRKIVEGISYARMISLILRIGSNKPDDTFQVVADIQRALQAPVLLPALIFPLINLQDLSIQALGYGDLLVVKEHIIGYELGEIARIENVLSGENSQHQYEHDLTTTNTTVTTTTTTTEDVTELDQTEHLALHNETTNTIQEDLSAKGDVHLSYSGVVNFSANAEVAWSQSKNTATKSSSDYAKDVTTRASNKVTRQFSQQVTQQITEMLKDLETHGLSNTTPNHVRGVYQWVTAVYEAQIFSYGNRILLDMLVPEPGAFLRSGAVQQSAASAPIPPMQLSFSPDQILDKRPDPNDTNLDGTKKYPQGSDDPVFKADDLRFYGNLATAWGLTDFEAPPEENLVLTKLISGAGDKAPGGAAAAPQTVEIKIKPGFRAARGRLSALLTHDDSTDAGLWAAIGALEESSWSATAGRSVPVQEVFQGTRGYIGDPGADKVNRIMGISNGLVFVKYIRQAAIDRYGNLKDPKPPDPGDPLKETVTTGTVTFDLGYDDYVPKYQASSQSQVPTVASGALSGPAFKAGTFFQETDSIAVSVVTDSAIAFSVHLEIHCERSPKALADWQAKIFAKIQTVYQKQKQDYDDKIAALAFQAGASKQFTLGASPDENRKVERTELKKACIQFLLGPSSELDFNGIINSGPPASRNIFSGGGEAPQIVSPKNGFDTTNTELFIWGWGVIGAVVTITDGGSTLGSFPVQDDGHGVGQWQGVVNLGIGSHVLIATQRFSVDPITGDAVTGVESTPSYVSGVVRPAATPLGAELPYPQPTRPLDPNFARAVRFFEQAFEWENISSFLYPYYWGRRENWYDLAKFTSDDPLHQQFLRAGAARVVLAVRPTFNADVIFFLITGKLFITGDVPQLGEPDYFPITDEVRAESDALYDPVPVPDQSPWEIRIPTKFLWLRKDDKKPAWQPRGAVNWTPPESPTWSWENNPNDPFDDGE